MTEDNHKRVYCDLCQQKIYLESFPENWDEMTREQRHAYMNGQVETKQLLSGWNDTGGPVEEWVTICTRCGK